MALVEVSEALRRLGVAWVEVSEGQSEILIAKLSTTASIRQSQNNTNIIAIYDQHGKLVVVGRL